MSPQGFITTLEDLNSRPQNSTDHHVTYPNHNHSSFDSISNMKMDSVNATAAFTSDPDQVIEPFDHIYENVEEMRLAASVYSVHGADEQTAQVCWLSEAVGLVKNPTEMIPKLIRLFPSPPPPPA